MTGKTTDPGPERLAALAALIEGNDDDAMMASATTAELDLADAVLGGSMDRENAAAIAGLLRLADGTDMATLLCLGLREAFLDGKPDDRAAAFADVFRRLALPGLQGDARERAAVILGEMGRP